jgi:lysophospholipase L1-like esterase
VHEPDDGTHTPYKHESRMLNRGNYPLLLRSLLASDLIYNFGHGGRTAVNGSDAFVRTPTYLAALVSAPHVVVLMLGTNDAKTRFWPRYRDKYEAALHRLAHDFLELPSRPGLVLMAPPPVVPGPASCKCASTSALSRGKFRRLSAEWPSELGKKSVPSDERALGQAAVAVPALRAT